MSDAEVTECGHLILCCLSGTDAFSIAPNDTKANAQNREN